MNPFLEQMVGDAVAGRGRGRAVGRIAITLDYAGGAATAHGPGRDGRIRRKRLRLPPVGDHAALDAAVASAERYFTPYQVSTVIVSAPPFGTREVATAFRYAVDRLAEVRNIFAMILLDPATKARASELGLDVPPIVLRDDGMLKVRDPAGATWDLDCLRPGPWIYGARVPPEGGTTASS